MIWTAAALARHGSRVALIEGSTGVAIRYDELAEAVERVAERLSGPRTVVACRIGSDCASVSGYLGAVAAGHAVLLLEPTADEERTRRIREAYRPGLWLEPASSASAGAEFLPAPPGAEGRVSLTQGSAPSGKLHSALTLLMTTSGSTGSPKLVRLGATAVESNARSIAEALAIEPDDVAIATLPLHYSYGLSVLHTHLLVGACTVLTSEAVIVRAFWNQVGQHGVTSLAGVPYTYEMLRRVKFDPAEHPSIRVLTQAGGRLAPERVQAIHQRAAAVGVRFYVMYGQTEATARIAVLPSSELPARLGSVGLAVPGGRLSIREHEAELPRGETGEIVYQGPNVMMGYAEGREDLERDDDRRGSLDTGDLGYLDEEGFLYVTGRRSRLAKVFGTRVDLDDVERRLLGPGAVAVDADGKLGIVGEFGPDEAAAAKRRVAMALGVHPSGVVVHVLPALPRLPSGKVDYASARLALGLGA